MSKKARSLVFLGPSDGEKVLLCFKWGVLNYALECRLDGVQNHSRSRPYLCTRAFSDGVGWPSPLLHGREDFWVIIHFCCWVGILCVCFQVDIVLHFVIDQILIFHHNLQINSLKILQCDFLDFFSYFVSHSWGIPMMKITGLSHLFKRENLHNWWLTKYFFAPLYIYIYIYIYNFYSNVIHYHKYFMAYAFAFHIF